MATTANSSRRTRKIAAIAAGILVVGVAATYTLASWTDSEWVWGGADGDAVGTSKFEVEQFTEGDWHQDETNPGGALDFTAAAQALAPGDTVYAPVSLRTVTGSVGGDVTLQGAVQSASATAGADAPGVGLWSAVNLTVHTSAATVAPDCTSAAFTAGDWTEVPGVSAASLSAGATPTTGVQTLAAATTALPGAPQHYCFVINLPTDAETTFQQANSGMTLQGRTIAPAWEFAAESN
ncbi:SipW-dependent-type signal peptide-containing protein [Leucobacter sp. HY1908]